MIQKLIALYDAWHEAEPHAGYDTRAAEWRTKLEPDAEEPLGESDWHGEQTAP